jgi:hypothetical protein
MIDRVRAMALSFPAEPANLTAFGRRAGQMRALARRLLCGLIVFAIAPPAARMALSQAAARAVAVGDSNKTFDPHDLSGVWRLDLTQKATILFKSSEAEPPLTDWGKQHLYEGGITHGSNPIPSGHFPGENCGPIAVPAQFAYLRFYPFENIQLPGRIHQVFELHREWRDIWLNRDHPQDLTPTYMGDSVGKWEGNTLVVDTIGYNGKDFVTEDVDHPMSSQFHLVERYTRTSYNTMKVEMTLSDPKVWGGKSWGGFTRILKLQDDHLQEWMCVPEVDSEFNRKIMQPTYGSEHLNLPKEEPKK